MGLGIASLLIEIIVENFQQQRFLTASTRRTVVSRAGAQSHKAAML